MVGNRAERSSKVRALAGMQLEPSTLVVCHEELLSQVREVVGVGVGVDALKLDELLDADRLEARTLVLLEPLVDASTVFKVLCRVSPYDAAHGTRVLALFARGPEEVNASLFHSLVLPFVE